MLDRRVTLGVVAALAALLVACASQVAAPPQSSETMPTAFPAAYYQRQAAQGHPVFRVDPARSLVYIQVRRSGSLARLGHDHVIASHDVAGYIAPDEGRADFYVPLNALIVDETALRSELGFDTQPSAADIAGTRSNMLEKVLDAGRFPHALIAVDTRAGGAAQDVRVAVTLHGTTRSTEAAARWSRSADEISVTGTMAIDQSQFGIAPFSILGGAIAVQDRVNITYRIVARRTDWHEAP